MAGNTVKEISLKNTVVVDAIAWWIDSGATTYVCKDRCWFKTYEPMEDGSVLYMGDDHFAPIYGKGSVVLEFSSVKSNTLFNVLYVPKLQVELHQNDLIKILRTDRGDEYYDPVFLQSVGIIHETTAPYTPKQNGVAERKNKALKEMVNSMLSYSDPRTYNEAMQSRYAAFWKESIDDEIGSLIENNTCVISDFPPCCKPLGCKWIFKRKMKVDGTIDKFKARLVIQGFRQKEEIDYFDTYAPVARITSIRLLLALAAIHNLVLHQMDVKTSFLNGDLDEEVYMKQPGRICYAGKFDNSGKGVIICLYVDDMLIFGTHQYQVDKTKKFLSSRFSMKDMGKADVILVEKLKPNTGKHVDQLEYSRAIGCLMYAMTSTRPDIAYDAGRLSYSDASWINRVEDSSSTSEWVFLLEGGAILWASKKQTRITSSTIESEFIALADAGARSKWTTYVNMKFSRFKKLGLSFLYVHQWIVTHGL
nr:zinc finger, CCHC-type [Tanacetum cinerariifolium]